MPPQPGQATLAVLLTPHLARGDLKGGHPESTGFLGCPACGVRHTVS